MLKKMFKGAENIFVIFIPFFVAINALAKEKVEPVKSRITPKMLQPLVLFLL